jgi:hypothetical protein
MRYLGFDATNIPLHECAAGFYHGWGQAFTHLTCWKNV